MALLQLWHRSQLWFLFNPVPRELPYCHGCCRKKKKFSICIIDCISGLHLSHEFINRKPSEVEADKYYEIRTSILLMSVDVPVPRYDSQPKTQLLKEPSENSLTVPSFFLCPTGLGVPQPDCS